MKGLLHARATAEATGDEEEDVWEAVADGAGRIEEEGFAGDGAGGWSCRLLTCGFVAVFAVHHLSRSVVSKMTSGGWKGWEGKTYLWVLVGASTEFQEIDAGFFKKR